MKKDILRKFRRQKRIIRAYEIGVSGICELIRESKIIAIQKDQLELLSTMIFEELILPLQVEISYLRYKPERAIKIERSEINDDDDIDDIPF